MKFKLVEEFSSGNKSTARDTLSERISDPQKEANKKLKRKLAQFNIDGTKYVVHHLDSDIVSDVKSLMDNSLENVLFLPKTESGDSNAVHQFIHAAAKVGGCDKFLSFLDSLNKQSNSPIYALRVDDNDNIFINAITLSDAVNMTIKGKV